MSNIYRVTHLMQHGRKYRTRRKNMNRIINKWVRNRGNWDELHA